MSFSTITFLLGFLGLFLVVYRTIPGKFITARNLFLLVASYLFYFWGAPGFVPLLFLSTLADYILGLLMGGTGRKHLILIISVLINLGLLAYFKYTNFLLGEFSRLLTTLGFNSLVWTHIALPLGISFFTFQKISYIIDVYRGTVPPQRNFINFALYVSLFPKLIAGPIVAYHDIAGQLSTRDDSIQNFYRGIIRFCYGLGKKVLIADSIGIIADRVFQAPVSSLGLPTAWLGILCYTFQIYFDFAGYTDMAIGLGRMTGFTLPENFNFPYISTSIREFWQRWHMSLTNWLRNYLYIPLGGNRVSTMRTFLNLWIVFIATGLWHGANWTFLFWGFYHGALLTIDRLLPSSVTNRIPKILSLLSAFILVLIGWVFFRSNTIAGAFGYMSAMFNVGTFTATQDIPFLVDNKQWVFLGIAAILCFYPYFTKKLRSNQTIQRSMPAIICLNGLAAVIVLIYSVIVLSGATYNPFIYSRF